MSNSLLMNLMIEKLLNENPRLKKNLLKEAGEYPVLTPQEQGVNIEDTDEFNALPHEHKVLSTEELAKAKEPIKGGGLVKALKNIGKKIGVGAITVGMLAIANFHDMNNKSENIENPDTQNAISQIAGSSQQNQQNHVLADQIVKEFESAPDFDDTTIMNIIKHEGFSGIPYIDVNNVSIGHGTGLYFGSKSKPSKIKPTWLSDLYKLYSVPKNIQILDSPDHISKETAKFIFNKKYNEIKNKLYHTSKYLNLFPERIQAAVLDLAYNMGPSFTKKFKLFDENMSLAGKAIQDQNIDMANIFLQSAADELVNNYGRGPTKYAQDLKHRSKQIHAAISSPITDLDVNKERINPPDKRYKMENKKYSLKSVFFS